MAIEERYEVTAVVTGGRGITVYKTKLSPGRSELDTARAWYARSCAALRRAVKNEPLPADETLDGREWSMVTFMGPNGLFERYTRSQAEAGVEAAVPDPPSPAHIDASQIR